MGSASHDLFLDLISGRRRGPRATLTRAALRLASWLYGGIMRLRNATYSAGWRIKRLPRPVVSVGNITTGGTGKTPVVRWLCERLIDAGRRPAVLMRGYRALPGQVGDEQAMLTTLLQGAGAGTVVEADPDRHAAGQRALERNPAIDVFVMDDGFQHRRLHRDVDLVLVDACNPFGFEHILPRGLLREPLAGLRRAHAVLITRSDQVSTESLQSLRDRISQIAPRVPLFQSSHAHCGFRLADGGIVSLDWLAAKKFFAFAGIGNPQALQAQLAALPGACVGTQWWPDHWNYSGADVDAMQASAKQAGADVLLTTEKDWVKVAPLARATDLPVARIELTIRFAPRDEERLLDVVMAEIEREATT